MNRQLIQSLLLAVVILILAILAWQLSNKDLALVLGSLLAARLIDQFLVFGKKAEEYTLLEEKLKNVYSPIHSMIIAISNVAPRERALQTTIIVSAGIIDIEKLSLIFKQYAHILGNNNLQMWLSIERETQRIYGFQMNKERQEWLDKLEAEYQSLLKELKKLT